MSKTKRALVVCKQFCILSTKILASIQVGLRVHTCQKLACCCWLLACAIVFINSTCLYPYPGMVVTTIFLITHFRPSILSLMMYLPSSLLCPPRIEWLSSGTTLSFLSTSISDGIQHQIFCYLIIYASSLVCVCVCLHVHAFYWFVCSISQALSSRSQQSK